jgi:hypothetical protein
MCCKAEHMKHIAEGSTTLVPSEYTNRHNKAACYICWMISQHIRVQATDIYSKHISERIININSTTSMWDILVIIGQTVLADWPDIVLRDKKEKTCLLIAIAIPDESNFNIKETKKLSKYKDLEIELSRSWKVRTKLCQL